MDTTSLTWRPMRNGRGRTTGYAATLPDGTAVYVRNTGGRRSLGTWVAEAGQHPATVRLARSTTLAGVKADVERHAAEMATG